MFLIFSPVASNLVSKISAFLLSLQTFLWGTSYRVVLVKKIVFKKIFVFKNIYMAMYIKAK